MPTTVTMDISEYESLKTRIAELERGFDRRIEDIQRQYLEESRKNWELGRAFRILEHHPGITLTSQEGPYYQRFSVAFNNEPYGSGGSAREVLLRLEAIVFPQDSRDAVENYLNERVRKLEDENAELRRGNGNA